MCAKALLLMVVLLTIPSFIKCTAIGLLTCMLCVATLQGNRLPHRHLEPPDRAAVRWLPKFGGPHGVLAIRAEEITTDELIASLVRKVRIVYLLLVVAVRWASSALT